MAAGLCLIHVTIDEWHQTFVPERGGVISDVLIDAIGVLIVGLFLYRRRRANELH